MINTDYAIFVARQSLRRRLARASAASLLLLSVFANAASSGSALQLDGDNDYIAVTESGSPSSLDLTGNQVSFSLWLKTSDDSGMIALKSDSASATGVAYNLRISAGDLKLEVGNGSGYDRSCTADVGDGDWNHWVATFTGSSFAFFKNGVSVSCTASGSTGTLGAFKSITQDLVIGRFPAFGSYVGGQELEGSLDELAIFSDALSSSEAAAIYNSGSYVSTLASNSGDYSSSGDLVGYWRFNEGSGTSIGDSASSNNGTLTNAAASAWITEEWNIPRLTSSTPSDDATAVEVNANIVLNFSEAVTVRTGDILIKRTSDNSTYETIDVASSQVTGSGTTQITIDPFSFLVGSTEYYLTIASTAFDDSVGNSYAGISSSTELSFTTKYAPPRITLPSALTGDASQFIDVDSTVISSENVRVSLTVNSGALKISATTGLTAPTGYTTGDWTSGSADEIAFEGTVANVNAALATLQYKGVSGTLNASVSPTGAAYFDGSGSYYTYVPASAVAGGAGLTWVNARAAAKATTLNGAEGYLATVTSSEELAFVRSKVGYTTAVWLGGNDIDLEGVWRWNNDPGVPAAERNVQFWSGGTSGSAQNDYPSFWGTSEPNNVGTGEDALQITTEGVWNDLPHNSSKLGYIIEYTPSSGEASSASLSIARETTPPTMTITAAEVADGDTSNDGTLSLTFTASEPTTNFAAGDITVTNGALSSFASSSSSVYTATFTPTATGATTIDVAANTFTDAAGNNNTAAAQFNWNYDGTAPTMTITAAEVSDGDTSNDATLTLTFTASEPTTNFAAGDITVTNGTLSSFASSSSTVYTTTFTPSAEGAATIDVNANTFTDAVSNNNTASAQFNWTYDATAPTLVSSTPADDATGVSASASTITLTFSENVFAGTGNVTLNSLSLPAFTPEVIAVGGGSIAGFGSNTLTLTLATTLSNGAVYSLQVPSGAFVDAAGTAFAGLTSARDLDFLVGTASAPTLTASSPADDASAVATTATSITLTFSENVFKGTGNLTLDSTSIPSFTPIVTAVSDAGITGSGTNQITIPLGTTLVDDGAYNLQLPSGVFVNAAGTAFTGLTSASDLNFFAGTAAAPTLVSSTPADDATGVSASTSTITLTFSENVFAGTGSVTLDSLSLPTFTPEVIAVGGGSIAGFGSNTLTLTLATTLSNGAVYSLQVPSGAFVDAAGTAFAGLTSARDLDFLVGTASAPTLTASSPADDASAVATTATSITLTFNENVFKGTGNLTLDSTSIPSFTPIVTAVSDAGITGSGTNQITIPLGTTLLDDGAYKLQFPSGVFVNAAGTAFAGLTSASDLNFFAGTAAAPTLVSSTPADDATGVSAATTTITLTFSENVFASSGNLTLDATSVSGFTPLVFAATGSAISGSGTNQITLTSSTALGSDRDYSLTIDSTAFVDAAGTAYAGIATATGLNFTMVDTIAPTVTLTSSAATLKSGETATITFDFSETPTGFAAEDVVTTVGSLSTPVVDTGDDTLYTATYRPALNSTATPSITVTAGSYTDAAGNAGLAGVTPAISVDTAAPTLTITTDDTALTAGETATITFTFSEVPVGFAWNGSSGDVTVGGGTLSAIAATGDAKVFTAVLTPTANSTTAATVTVASGSYTDAAGNTGGAGAMPATTVNTVVPGAPVLTTSTSSISSTTPTLTGTAPANATVKIYNGSTLINTVTADGTGAWTLSITDGQLAEGANVITATATDSSGNVSPSSSAITLTLDTAAPSAPSITSGAGTSNDATPTFAGTAEPNSTVEVFVGGVSVGTAMADGTGAWTLTLSAGSVSDGANTITATATDAAGNASSASSAATLNLDTTAPAAAAVTTGDSTTTTAAFTIEGTAEANATVRILVGSSEVGTATADGSGDWSYTFASGELVDGANSVTVIVVDTAGNTSAASTAITITLESPPVIVIVDPTIRGEKTNAGTLNDPVITEDGSLSGGTLCGTIANSGSISDVKLCAGASIEGGSVSGDITGDDESPARIKATVKSGSRLSHVIIDKSAVLEPGVRLGAGVVLESLASVAPDTDLSSLTQSTSGGIDLTSTGLPGPDQNPLSLIERVRQLDVLRQPDTGAEQEPTRGSLEISLPGSSVKAMPQRVVKLAPDAEEGIFYDEDGNIRLVVTGPIEIIAFPEFSEEFPIKRAVETYDSELSMDINDEGNFTIEKLTTAEGPEADTAASQRFVGRPSVSAVNVSSEPTVNDEGWRFSPSPYLDNVDAVAFVRKDDSGELWEQQLVNRPADWFGFKEALLATPEVNKVSIDIEGVISIVFRGERVKAMTAYEVELNAASNKPGRPLVFLNAGDRNGDGAEDYYVYYPDGSRQLIYLFP